MSGPTVEFHAALNDAYRAANAYKRALSILAGEYERMKDTQSARVMRAWGATVQAHADNIGHEAQRAMDDAAEDDPPPRCRYSDCPEGHAVAAEKEQVTCPTCRETLGLTSLGRQP